MDYEEKHSEIIKMFILMFGKYSYEKLIKSKFKPVEWDGIEIDNVSILNTSSSIKQRLTEEFIKYSEDQNRTMFDIFINIVFQLGYCAGVKDVNCDIKELSEEAIKLLNKLKK